MSAAVEAYSQAVIARQWREEAATQMYATEVRNYRTNAYGDGEAPLKLVDCMRFMGTLEAQREAWQASLDAEARTLPAGCDIGRDVLEDALEEPDALERAFRLSEIIEQAQALLSVASKVRGDALRELRKTGMSLAAIGDLAGMSRQRVHQLTA